MENYDVVMIGSGPGGYVGAIRCAQMGFRIALVERYSSLGGTCLNVGCIPSKALLDSSEHFHNAKKQFAAHGIHVGELSFDWNKMKLRKEKVISDSCKGIQFLMKKNGIDLYEGHASFIDNHTISIQGKDGEKQEIKTDKTIIATGSKPQEIPSVSIDKSRIISSSEALNLPEVPKTLTVIGAGAIGLELGSVYARLGCKVSVIEYEESIIPTMDRALGKELVRSLKKLGMKFHLSHKVSGAVVDNESVIVSATDKNGKDVKVTGDYCLLAVGRKPYTEGLGLEKVDLKTNERGFLPVNEKFETGSEGIYAIGDVIGGAMLAHKAEEEAIFLAETLAGKEGHINYNAIPAVVYTWPEAAGVGKTEEVLKRDGVEYNVGSFSFRALGRARAANELDGLVKVLSDKTSDKILGVHMVGARVADMIAEAVVAVEFGLTAESIAKTSHAHPTFTEAFKEACMDASEGRAIHS